MALRLKLSHKIIGLVCFPLFCEFLFVGALLILLSTSDTQITALEHSKAVVSRVNELAGLLYGHVLMLARQQFSLGGEPISGDEGDLRETMQQLDELTYRNPDEAREAKKTIELTRRILGYTKTMEDSGSWQESSNAPKLFMLTTELIGTTRNFLRTEKQSQTTSDVGAMAENSRKNIYYLLLALLVLSTLITIGVAWRLQKTIAERLGVMRDNTYRLASNLPMHKIVEGSDEIAKLDEVFHQMADALKEAELERKRNEQLKADFVAMVSHDLRTPLTSTQLFISLLTQPIMDGIDVPTKAKKAEIEIARLIRLINNLLDLEKAEGKVGFEVLIDSVPLSAVIQQAVAAVEDYGKQSNVKIEAPKTDLVVDADEDKIVQVLVNLVSNAIKFSPPQSTVRIEIKSDPEYIEISIIDSGRGIPKQFHQAIFDRYKQVTVADERLKGGTGLGLAICKIIVELHGGKIGVESEEGQGSRFWFRLPQRPLLS
jgi:signal transduction histidine kinase